MGKQVAKICVDNFVVLNLKDGLGQVAEKLTALSADNGLLKIGKWLYYLSDFIESLSIEPTREDLYLVVRRCKDENI